MMQYRRRRHGDKIKFQESTVAVSLSLVVSRAHRRKRHFGSHRDADHNLEKQVTWTPRNSKRVVKEISVVLIKKKDYN